LKKGNAQALAFFGFEKGAEAVEVSNLQYSPEVRIGDKLDFSFQLSNHAPKAQPLRLEYQIDYHTLSGKISSKVFKIKIRPLGFVGAFCPLGVYWETQAPLECACGLMDPGGASIDGDDLAAVGRPCTTPVHRSCQPFHHSSSTLLLPGIA
jgi:hypothetical protein